MPKKKTFEEVEAAFKLRGYTLLSLNYQGSQFPLNYICSNRHQSKISFKHLQRGVNCLECSGKKKKTIEEVKNLFESKGFTLLSVEYKSNKSPLDYICNNGHQTSISFGGLQKGYGCAECVGLKKKEIEEVRELFDSRGYQLLSDEYKNNSSPLKYVCNNGHNAKISFAKLQRGQGCLECSGHKKKTLEEVRNLFATRGYTLLSKDYRNSNSPLDYICDKGHQTNIFFSSLQNGYGCASCARKKKKTIEEVRLAFTQKGFSLLSNDYSNNNSPLDYLCDNGHQNKISFKLLQRGIGCSSCAEHGFNSNKPAFLYYIRFQFEGNFYYKIGITNRKTSERFQKEKTPYTVIKETHYTIGKGARDKEQEILKKFDKYRYKGLSFLTMRGDTELFNRDVLQLDSSVLSVS